jgi:hypothetical protein
LIFSLGISFAQESDSLKSEINFGKYHRDYLSVGVAASYAYFGTTAKFIDNSDNSSIFIDAEGSLNLEEFQFIPTIYVFWRMGERHQLGFSYFRINRSGRAINVDADFGSLEVKGNVYVYDRSSFYYVNYSYIFYHDDRASLLASFGIFGANLDLSMNAEGDIKYDGDPVISGIYSKGFNQIIPLPLFGLQANFSITPRWLIGTRFAFAAAKFDDTSAAVLESKSNLRYVFNKYISILAEISFFKTDVSITKDGSTNEIKYNIDALFFGIDVGF